ncbi:hypothetical protein KHA80_04850 [Anaerobacillus sp. HL2]|nr:hypothetical protein KHA80_04850 [Anaerobacillus sp. HL2]
MIISAFLLYPPLYIVDETFIGLDPIAIKSLLNHIVKMKQDGAGNFNVDDIFSRQQKDIVIKLIMLHHGKIY